MEANDNVWEKNLNVSAQDKSNVIINMNLQGSCLSPAEIFRDEHEGRSVKDRNRVVWII